MNLRIRQAAAGDQAAIAALIRQLAQSIGETSPITEAYVALYLSSPGSQVLLAEEEGRTVGLLSYSVRPNLYHAGDCGLIEELIVHPGYRRRGIARALLSDVLGRLRTAGCAEVSVSTLPENEPAKRLYRSFGLVDEALVLEKHFSQQAVGQTFVA